MHKNGALAPRVRVSEDLMTETASAPDEPVAIRVHAAGDEKVILRAVGADDLPPLDPSPCAACRYQQRKHRDQGSSKTHTGMLT